MFCEDCKGKGQVEAQILCVDPRTGRRMSVTTKCRECDGTGERLARFGHHADAATDYCLEVECVEGLVADVRARLQDPDEVEKRIERAMYFRVGGDLHAVNAKHVLRQCEGQLAEILLSRHCADYRTGL